MTTATKWALAVGVLALALLVALLPRTDGLPSDEESGSAELDAARERAALPACAAPSGGGDGAGGEELADTETACLADGSRLDMDEVLGAGPTVLNVWATWCEPCRDELPLLRDYAEEPGAARVVTVQVQSSPADGLALLAELGVRLPAVHDGEGMSGPLRQALRVPTALPASYVVTDGEATLVDDPRVFASVEQIRDAVERVR